MVEIEEGTTKVKISTGVAQSSVKGPAMWNVEYVRLLRIKVPKGVKLEGYVDDVAIVAVTKSTQKLELKCNDTLDLISNLTKEHGLKLAQEKSETLITTKKRKFYYPKLELEGHPTRFENSIRYLGIWIDRVWNFKNHIKASSKTAKIDVTLQQLMPNIGGPKPES